jgi:Ser/Thr protein kinase RdoA (MazF antagonist)
MSLKGAIARFHKFCTFVKCENFTVFTSMTKDVFPVIYSTLASDAIISKVLPHYKIGMAFSCQFWHRGLSDVYLVETPTAQYILRVAHHHWRSKADIEFELELLDFLQQRQIPAAYPLRTKDDRLSIEINAPEGKRYAALFIKAPGAVALGDLNPKQSRLLGETLAKLHQAAIDFHSHYYRQPLTLEYLLDDSFQIIAPFLQHRTTDWTYMVEAIAQLKHQLQDLPKEPPFWGICWGDPHSGNAHFTTEGEVTLFDFDQCGYGWRAFDIAKFLQVSLSTGISKSVREAFLAGYQAVCEVTENELALLQAFTQTAHIWTWAISLNAMIVHNYSRLDDSYLQKRLEQLKRLKSPDWQLF